MRTHSDAESQLLSPSQLVLGYQRIPSTAAWPPVQAGPKMDSTSGPKKRVQKSRNPERHPLWVPIGVPLVFGPDSETKMRAILLDRI